MTIEKVCGNLWMTEKGMSVIGPEVQGHDLIHALPFGSQLDLETGVVSRGGEAHATLFAEAIAGVKAHVERHVRVITQVTQPIRVVGG